MYGRTKRKFPTTMYQREHNLVMTRVVTNNSSHKITRLMSCRALIQFLGGNNKKGRATSSWAEREREEKFNLLGVMFWNFFQGGVPSRSILSYKLSFSNFENSSKIKEKSIWACAHLFYYINIIISTLKSLSYYEKIFTNNIPFLL